GKPELPGAYLRAASGSGRLRALWHPGRGVPTTPAPPATLRARHTENAVVSCDSFLMCQYLGDWSDARQQVLVAHRRANALETLGQPVCSSSGGNGNCR